MRRAAAALAAAALLVTGACDGGGGTTIEALIEAGLLRIEDFPDGWESTLAEEDDAESDTFARVPGCEGLDAELAAGEVEDRDSDEFASGDTGASNNVTVYGDAEEAAASIALGRSERFLDCVRRLGPIALEQSAGGEAPEVAAALRDARVEFERLPVEGVGEEAVGFQGVITFSLAGTELQFFMELVVVRVGRVILAFELQNPLTPFDPALRARIVDGPVDRVTAS